LIEDVVIVGSYRPYTCEDNRVEVDGAASLSGKSARALSDASTDERRDRAAPAREHPNLPATRWRGYVVDLALRAFHMAGLFLALFALNLSLSIVPSQAAPPWQLAAYSVTMLYYVAGLLFTMLFPREISQQDLRGHRER
jgi:hypothetical protein